MPLSLNISTVLTPDQAVHLRNELPFAFVVDFQKLQDNYSKMFKFKNGDFYDIFDKLVEYENWDNGLNKFKEQYLEHLKINVTQKFNHDQILNKEFLIASSFEVEGEENLTIILCGMRPLKLADCIRPLYEIGFKVDEICNTFNTQKDIITHMFNQYEAEDLKEKTNLSLPNIKNLKL